MMFTVCIMGMFMIKTRNMREFAAVGIWALVAIAYRQWDAIPLIQWTALSGAVILFIAIAIHGYLNRATNILVKLREYISGPGPLGPS